MIQDLLLLLRILRSKSKVGKMHTEHSFEYP